MGIEEIRVIDCFPYNGELIAEYRLKYLYDVVDAFVIVESRETYSGVRKNELFFEKNRAIFEPYMDKIYLVTIDDFPEPSDAFVRDVVPRFDWMKTVSINAWWRELYQRQVGEDFVKAQWQDKRYVLLAGDVDEIPRVELLKEAGLLYPQFSDGPVYLGMDFFYYNFNWLKREKWFYAMLLNDISMQTCSLSAMRLSGRRLRVIENAGWHCSYFASRDELRRKLESFSHMEFNNDNFKTDEHLDNCFYNGKDIVGRGGNEDLVANTSMNELPEWWQDIQNCLINLQKLEKNEESHP